MFSKTQNAAHVSYLSAILAVALFLVVPKSLLAGSLLLSWDPIQDGRLSGYKIKYGTVSGSHALSVDVGNQATHTLQGLTEGLRYYFVIVGYDGNRVEGTASSEISGLVLAVSAISSSSLATTSAVVSWLTNKPADTQVEYGTTTAYGSLTALDGTRVATHSQTLTSLQPATTYQFRVRSRDEGGSTVLSPNFTFTTKTLDTTPPNDVANFTAIPSNGRVSLSWTNPADADFKGVMLRYRTDGIYPTSKTEGFLAVDRPGVTGATEHFDHLSLVNGVTYHYSAFTYDTALNYSSTAHTQATPVGISITSLSPNRGSVGTSVVITGTGFGAMQGTSKVTFNGSVAQVSTWSATSITAIVPPNATSGLVIVTVGGAQTNGLSFKVGGKLGAPGKPRITG